MSTILTAVVTIAALAAVAGLLLAIASRRLPAAANDLEDRVDALLPQTQCAQCGYPGCRPYARAIVGNGAPINLCPPGGDHTVARLAELLGREMPAMPVAAHAGRRVAVIDEDACIGCMHCRRACPVDAIIGAQHLMHTIISDECTGCELCIAPCPVDCIAIVPHASAPLEQVA